ncbi:type VII secretion target [Nocardia sp. alder85J]|uniref:type VII secretion target n=1 Tax=Nocardia sp. alder85J TaxID=2862949 RepID=UPI001CD1B313|nr:type VII secretion target [Nocardia sp. alder85J]MCX4092183.1 type VII secretion target [Nocardia sp. alder85J]
MPDSLDIDPEVLRQLASQHDRVAADTRTWAQPPQAWLDGFHDSYGAIADPVRQALVNYYGARQRAGEALAKEHDNTAQALRDAARAYELADQHGAQTINNNGNQFGGSHAPPGAPGTTGSPTHPGPGDTGTNPNGGPGTTGSPQAPGGAAPGGPGGSAPGQGGGDNSPTGPGNGSDGMPSLPGRGADAPYSNDRPPTTSLDNLGAGGPGGPGAGVMAGGGDDGRGGPSGPPSGATAGGSTQDAIDTFGAPVPMMSPFAAAVAAAADRERGPDFVVNADSSDDLVLARTLLGAVLAAVDSPVGMTWAVSVMRGPAGAGVFITSNEGRGWMPAGLFLPREVSSPWMWDELLAADGGSPWEGVADPARVLAEFGLVWGPKAGAKLSALVSSGPIDSSLRLSLNEVPMQGMVGPIYDVDLRHPTPDTNDRLGLFGSVGALEQVAAVPDSAVYGRCLTLAGEAHAQVGRATTTPAEAVEARAVRGRILAMVQAGQPVQRMLWDQLRDADDLLAAAMLSRRVDVGRVDLGGLRVSDEGAALRAMVFERRCNELALLLAGGGESRQTLRDAVYVYDQITAHPQFVAPPAAVTVTEEHVAVQTVSGAVAAPVTAGPPGGAVPPVFGVSAPRTDAPPVAGPDSF